MTQLLLDMLPWRLEDLFAKSPRVSPDAIRKAVLRLETKGLIVRRAGGVYLRFERPADEPLAPNQKMVGMRAKERMCLKCKKVYKGVGKWFPRGLGSVCAPCLGKKPGRR